MLYGCVSEHLTSKRRTIGSIRIAQETHQVCSQLKFYCQRRSMNWIRPLKAVRMELAVAKGLLLRGNRVVIPKTLQKDILEKLHSRHQETTKCRQHAKHSVQWPRLRKDIDETGAKCERCCKARTQHPEPILPSPLPL